MVFGFLRRRLAGREDTMDAVDQAILRRLPVAAGGLLLLGGLTLVSVRAAPAEDAGRPARHDVTEPAVGDPVP